MTRPGTLGPLESRRGQLNADARFQVAVQHLVVNAQIVGSGEAQLDLTFPLLFISQPKFSAGSHMAPNAQITSGSFPVVTAVVHSWKTTKIALATYWVGAHVGVVSLGVTGQSVAVDLHFQEQAIRGPQGGTSTVTDGAL